MYFSIAANDDMRQPDAKDKLKAAFAEGVSDMAAYILRPLRQPLERSNLARR
jgi:hypothetical protein